MVVPLLFVVIFICFILNASIFEKLNIMFQILLDMVLKVLSTYQTSVHLKDMNLKGENTDEIGAS